VDASVPESVVGDRLRVEQIIVNMLSNAAKFTSTGQVELSAISVDKSRWEVSVRDTGTGIAPHMQEIIFEPFRQVDGTTSRQIGGSGLGLAISRELCQIMDGTLRVESEVGRGSTFTMTLPINVDQPELGADVLQKISR
jgi:signal transduction histidine kinase